MQVDCPKCGYTNDDIDEYLPKDACDDREYECRSCCHTFRIGWTAEVEVRNDCLD